jgi:23S rRNA pseudouridine1911/1915/1917 synthase
MDTSLERPGPVVHHFKVNISSRGQRLDSFLADELAGESISRSRIKELLAAGDIMVNGNPAKPSYRLRSEDELTVEISPPVPTDLEPEKVDFEILHEDEDILVISKPPGLVVHPACGHDKGTLVHGLLFHCDDLSGINGEERPGIVHRLDMDTSGAMVVAKNDHAHHNLVSQFKERQVEKIYRAIVYGVPESPHGRISLPIGRHQSNRRKMAVRKRSGRPAATNWSIIEVFANNISYIELLLETGRTHQIRVHMAASGHPIAGDQLYGKKNHKRDQELAISRQCLHSYRLAFSHPRTGDKMSFLAPLWPDIENSLELIRKVSG